MSALCAVSLYPVPDVGGSGVLRENNVEVSVASPAHLLSHLCRPATRHQE